MFVVCIHTYTHTHTHTYIYILYRRDRISTGQATQAGWLERERERENKREESPYYGYYM